MTVTTPLQTFALIITAEPHFMVTRPSQTIMLENIGPVGDNARNIPTVPAVNYFGNSSDYFRDPRTPEIAEVDYSKTPPAILQAKQAVALARFAGAERDASTELNEAETLLQNAERAWAAGRDSDTVDIAARRAIATAVKAESLAAERKTAREKRNEQTRTDAEIRAAESRFTDAQEEITNLKAELAREIRNRELAERDSLNYSNQVKELRTENGQLREDLGRMRVELDSAKAQVAAIEAEKKAAQEQTDKTQKAAAIKSAEPQLISSLKSFGSVARSDRGIVLTLPESLWTGTRSSDLMPQSGGKLSSLGEILANNPDYRITIESHTDNSGNADELQSLTDKRSYAIADKLTSLGVAEGRIMAKGFGGSSPAVPNTTAANKAKNRRTQVILTLFLQ
jgi:outer membrane protein OmpA-like peptidoglycan-associated protein